MTMEKNTDVDKIIRQEEGRQISAKEEESVLKERLADGDADAAARSAQQSRDEKVRAFSLDLELDDYGPDPEIVRRDEETSAEVETASELSDIPQDGDDDSSKKNKKKNAPMNGCLKRILYVFIILVLSMTIAYFAISYMMDALGINKSDDPIDFEIPSGASTQMIADSLVEKGVIDNALYFRVYAKLSNADGKFQLGTFTLSADMGYSEIVRVLQTSTPRAEVTVTIPEGYTVPEIAFLLEEKEVCTQEEFYSALTHGDFDYDFIDAIPNDEAHAGRIYRLEGYLFPDTYNFYIGSSGKAVVEKMLNNFDSKFTPELRQKIAAADLTIDETVILASLIQGEAAKVDDMKGVSRVLFNRMDPNSGFAKLELCSTRDYVRAILPGISGSDVKDSPYNTYERSGLPVGAINNPGMDAINAVFSPSEDPHIKQCYFFATDYDTGITYFNKTFAQHEYTCRKYGIGAYG